MNESMEHLEIPYGFMKWTDDIILPFWVGEYTEIENLNEDGLDQSTFIITGLSESVLDLEKVKEKIKAYFPIEGRTAILENGSGIAVSYSTSIPVDSGKQGLYRLQINLNIKEWKGN